MAVEHLDATGFSPEDPVASHGYAGTVKCDVRTVEVTAAASVNSTYRMHRLPSNAAILPGSKILFDDLASAGAPTLDLGVFAVNGNLAGADDDDALNDGIDVATAAGEAALVKAIENWGVALWDHVAGEASDPGGQLDVKLTLKDAAANTGGTVTSVVFYKIES